MKKTFCIITIVMAVGIGIQGMAAANNTQMDHSKMGSADNTQMDHGKMDMSKSGGKKSADMNFKHKDVNKGIRAEFEIMSLEKMGMKTDDGSTHHIMIKIFNDSMNHQIKEAAGKIKLIDPDGKEKVVAVKNYSGIFAANLSFPKTGKYGVICLLKIKDEKPMFKFWYTHK